MPVPLQTPLRTPRTRSGSADFKASISSSGKVGTHYHYWVGASGRTYLHTVYAPDKVPLLARAVVLVAARMGGARQMLFLGQAGEDAAQLTGSAGYRRALEGGGVEVHVHFLAGSALARRQMLRDLEQRIAEAAPADLAA